MPTQEERRTATTAAIVGAARRLFTQQGFSATSVDDVARGAGVAKGGVYHHFETKEKLFESVFRTIEDELYDAVVAAVPRRATAADQLVVGTRVFMERCMQPDVHQVVLVDGPTVLGWRLWREIDAEHFLPLITASLSAGAPRGTDVTTIAQLLIGAIDEAVMILSSEPDPVAALGPICDDLERVLRAVTASLAR